MTRSFAVALVFLETRAFLGLAHLDHTGYHVVETVVWACNIFTLLAADIVLQCQEWFRSHPAKPAAT